MGNTLSKDIGYTSVAMFGGSLVVKMLLGVQGLRFEQDVPEGVPQSGKSGAKRRP